MSGVEEQIRRLNDRVSEVFEEDMRIIDHYIDKTFYRPDEVDRVRIEIVSLIVKNWPVLRERLGIGDEE